MNINIDVNSGIFKLFKFASKYTLAGLIIEKDYFFDKDNNRIDTLNSFNDVCTFIRHFFIGILFLMPITILFVSLILFFLIWLFVWIPVSALIGFGDSDTISAGYSVLIIYAIFCVSYLTICILQHRSKNKVKSSKAYKEPGTIGKIAEIISAKHSKFCTRINITDKEK